MVEQTRISKLIDIKDFDFYFKEPKYKPEILIFKKSNKEKTKAGLQGVLEILNEQKSCSKKINDFDTLLKRVMEEKNLSFSDVFWPVRAALSGKEASPSPGELLWVFGKEESIKRIKKAKDLLK